MYFGGAIEPNDQQADSFRYQTGNKLSFVVCLVKNKEREKLVILSNGRKVSL